jgi:predicted nucleic acid-binding protein
MRYVIDAAVAIRLATDQAKIPADHRLLAPTLIRSHVLSSLFEAVGRGETTTGDARAILDRIRGLRVRLLGDRVLQSEAWKIADQLGWAQTYDAEYLALTRLQADAFITLDADLSRAAAEVVPVATIDDLLGRPTA